MTRLVAALLRHADYRQLADTPSAHQPFPLTENGIQQAREAGMGLRAQAARQDWSIAREIHCSRLLRAWQTASIIAGELDGEHELCEYSELAERGMGSAANLTVQQIEAIVREDPRCAELPADWKSNSEFCLPLAGAESLLQAGRRVANHLLRSMQNLESMTRVDTLQVFVGHGAAIRHAAYELGVLEFGQIARLSMYHAEPIYIEYSGLGWKQIAGRWKNRNQSARLD